MKKLLFLAILLITIPMNAYAVSLETLQNDTSKYVKICEDTTSTIYLEPNKIKVLRDSFPYLTLQAKIYLVMYNKSSIADDSYIISYNYNRSLRALVINKKIESPNITNKELTSYAILEAKKDSGIAANIKANCYYDLDGTITHNNPIHIFSDKAKFETVLYSISNKVFYHYNQCTMYFFDGM